MTKIYNILIVGIGGQGVIKMGKFFQNYAMEHPNISSFTALESRGVSQREGSVIASVRYLLKTEKKAQEDEIFISGFPPKGRVDLLIALEGLEFYRYISYCRPDGAALVNRNQILPKSARSQRIELLINEDSHIESIQQELPSLNLNLKNFTLELSQLPAPRPYLNQYILKYLGDLNIPLFPTDELEKSVKNFFG
ncbi:MAG: 2-oxoacid:acceptor oxidoreductase family protein [Promethearchaeota archaeon]